MATLRTIRARKPSWKAFANLAMSMVKISPLIPLCSGSGRAASSTGGGFGPEQAPCDLCHRRRRYATCYEGDAVNPNYLRHECRPRSTRHCEEPGKARRQCERCHAVVGSTCGQAARNVQGGGSQHYTG